jgi:putative ABC transport system permease protein
MMHSIRRPNAFTASGPTFKTNSETLHYSISPWAMARSMQAEFPEVEAFVRVQKTEKVFRKGDVKFSEDNTILADSTLFSVFDLKLLKGNPKTALAAPLSLVLTETAARKYFGDKDPMGQTLLFDEAGESAMITGVMQDTPLNSQIKGDIFVSMSTYTAHHDRNEREWGILLIAQTRRRSGGDGPKIPCICTKPRR